MPKNKPHALVKRHPYLKDFIIPKASTSVLAESRRDNMDTVPVKPKNITVANDMVECLVQDGVFMENAYEVERNNHMQTRKKLVFARRELDEKALNELDSITVEPTVVKGLSIQQADVLKKLDRKQNAQLKVLEKEWLAEID